MPETARHIEKVVALKCIQQRPQRMFVRPLLAYLETLSQLRAKSEANYICNLIAPYLDADLLDAGLSSLDRMDSQLAVNALAAVLSAQGLNLLAQPGIERVRTEALLLDYLASGSNSPSVCLALGLLAFGFLQGWLDNTRTIQFVREHLDQAVLAIDKVVTNQHQKSPAQAEDYRRQLQTLAAA